jgi:hypothetical protein
VTARGVETTVSNYDDAMPRPFVRRSVHFLVLLVVLGGLLYYGTPWFRQPVAPREIPDERFRAPDAGFTVEFPGKPIEQDLSLLLVAPDQNGADEGTANIRRYEAEIGTIRGWAFELKDYRFGVRLHTPRSEKLAEARTYQRQLYDPLARFGFDLTNYPILDETTAKIKNKGGRALLIDRGNGRRMAVVIFPDGDRDALVFVEHNERLTLQSEVLHHVVGSVTFRN